MFKRTGIAVAVLIAGLYALASAPALADRGYGGGGWHGGGHGGWHGGWRGGIYLGVPLYAPYSYYYPPPYYYSPPPVVYVPPASPPVYVERGDVQVPAPAVPPPAVTSPSAPGPSAFWYYCTESDAYYPYVKECASEWKRVSPQPPSTSR